MLLCVSGNVCGLSVRSVKFSLRMRGGSTGSQSSYHVCVWGLRFVAVPTYFSFKTRVIVLIATHSTVVPLKTLAMNCHIRDLCQKVRYVAARGQDFDEYSG